MNALSVIYAAFVAYVLEDGFRIDEIDQDADRWLKDIASGRVFLSYHIGHNGKISPALRAYS